MVTLTKTFHLRGKKTDIKLLIPDGSMNLTITQNFCFLDSNITLTEPIV